MSTLILSPIANGYIGIPGVSSGEHWSAVLSADETFVYTAVGQNDYVYDLYVINSPVPSIDRLYKINSVKAYFRFSGYNGIQAYAYPKLQINGTQYDGSVITQTTASWVTYSQTWTTNPDTDQEWKWQDLCAIQAGIAMKCLYAMCKCTQFYIEVNYDSSNAMIISSTIFMPTSQGDITTIAHSSPSAHWDAVNDDDVSTSIWNSASESYEYDIYGIDTNTFSPCRILCVIISHSIAALVGGSGYAKPAMKIAGNVYYGTEVFHNNTTWKTYSSSLLAINPSTGQPWTWDDIRSMQIGIALRSSPDHYIMYCTKVYATVYHYPYTGRPRSQLIGLW